MAARATRQAQTYAATAFRLATDSGSDIVTALALGARAVPVGRAHLYGLAAAGEPGVRHALDILAGELRTAMALCGARSLPDLGRDLLRVSGPPRA
jgi:isopentenyl diphosphate isomerase/L-lactate dehydrogenase-like FMN-dependent dehydrogenase